MINFYERMPAELIYKALSLSSLSFSSVEKLKEAEDKPIAFHKDTGKIYLVVNSNGVFSPLASQVIPKIPFSKIKFKRKEDVWHQRFANKLLSLFRITSRYMEYQTILFNTIYLESRSLESGEDARSQLYNPNGKFGYILIDSNNHFLYSQTKFYQFLHECIHFIQFRQMGIFSGLKYLLSKKWRAYYEITAYGLTNCPNKDLIRSKLSQDYFVSDRAFEKGYDMYIKDLSTGKLNDLIQFVYIMKILFLVNEQTLRDMPSRTTLTKMKQIFVHSFRKKIVARMGEFRKFVATASTNNKRIRVIEEELWKQLLEPRNRAQK